MRPKTSRPAPTDDCRRARAPRSNGSTRRARAVIVGRDDVIELVLIALLADGHVLLEDYPGSGKTTLARCLGDSLESAVRRGCIAPFRRIQFTPDLLPSDVTGTSVFDLEHSRFMFRPGPIFAHIVLADEINRTSPKVQAAMLEAMAEKQVTIDNDTHPLDELFFVIATQNPLDVAGTYPLPTPQLDRFLFKIEMKHIEREAELDVLAQYPRPSLEHGARACPRSRRDELLARAARDPQRRAHRRGDPRGAGRSGARAARGRARAAGRVDALAGADDAGAAGARADARSRLRRTRGRRGARGADLRAPHRVRAGRDGQGRGDRAPVAARRSSGWRA